MEIGFPIEFIVFGTPVSLQSKRTESREQWKAKVRDAGSTCLPQPYFSSSEPMSISLFFFPEGKMDGDIDNMAKLVLDACCRHIYVDDAQVERLLLQKFEPHRKFPFAQPTDVLSSAMNGDKPALYVKISNDPHEDLL
jgi:crossover junction endodeoxyribonuclease RusA